MSAGPGGEGGSSATTGRIESDARPARAGPVVVLEPELSDPVHAASTTIDTTPRPTRHLPTAANGSPAGLVAEVGTMAARKLTSVSGDR